MDNRVVAAVAILIVVMQGYFAFVALQARTTVPDPTLTCEQAAEDEALLEAYSPANRPLNRSILMGAFLWVALMLPINVGAFLVITPQLPKGAPRRAFSYTMALTLILIVFNMGQIGLVRCALVSA